MLRLSRKHRWFAFGFLLAWALSHRSSAGAQDEKIAPSELSPSERIRKKLDQVIALDYAGQSFQEAILHLKDRTQLPVIVDQMALQQIGVFDGAPLQFELRNTRGKVRQALQHLLHGLGLDYVVLEDSLLITTEESATQRQMRQRLPVSVRELSAASALRELARQSGVALVIDPRSRKQAEQKVTLELEEASVETGLRLLAELVDLKAVRMGDVIFVTDAPRADRLRREESAPLFPFEGRTSTFLDRVGAPGVGAAPIVPPPPVPPADAKKAPSP